MCGDDCQLLTGFPLKIKEWVFNMDFFPLNLFELAVPILKEVHQYGVSIHAI